MMIDPKDRNPRDPDGFGPGLMNDGTLNVVPLDELAFRKALRDAEDDDEGIEDDDDLSDLDGLADL